jgi:AraC family transcriptional regulator
MAELAGISQRQFGRLFSQTTGLTPHQYVLRRRIAGAKDLLLNSQLPLTEISFILGFPSHAHFTATFKAKVGVTPNVFRNTRSATSGQLG